MAFRFWRRVRIAPGVTLNFSRSGVSASIGPRGAKFTAGPRGRRVTFGIPGTGLFYTHALPSRGAASSASRRAEALERRLTPGFFERLFTPAHERAFIAGCREFVRGDEVAALERLREALHLADGAFLAGYLALALDRPSEAAAFLASAAERGEELGRTFRRYGLDLDLELPVTPEITAHVRPGLAGALLGLVEAKQRLGRRKEAIAALERLLRMRPGDVVVKVSLAELLLEADPDAGAEGRRAAERVVELAEGLGNESPAHAAMLLYKGRALRRLGLLDAAREALTAGLRRRKGRPPELLRALRFERALVYEALGRTRQARADLERLYAEDPHDAEVARRLGRT
ncbi:MAG: DUF4236 domain-containing protein [Acidobacteria bacterium]|nr:MAG: DUF4236 domain-containing protein [Acidobacteriota bacterium]